MVTKQEAEELIGDAKLFHRTHWPEYIGFKKAIDDHKEWRNLSLTDNIPENIEHKYNIARRLIQSSKP